MMFLRSPSQRCIVTIIASSGAAMAQDCRWTTMAVDSPSVRNWPAAAYDSLRHRLVVFGGYGSNGVDLRETWEWTGSGWVLAATGGPSARRSAQMAFDSARGKMVLFGGQSSGSYPNDTWEWDGANWVQVDNGASGPPPRTLHMLAYDPIRARTVMFGGNSYGVELTTTLEWNGAVWEERSSVSLDSMSRGSGAFNPARGKILMAAWRPYPNGAFRTQEWDGTAWTQLAASSPGGLNDRVFLDTARGVLMHVDSGHYTVEWNGTSWVNPNNNGPTGASILGYDSQLQRGVAIESVYPPYTAATWLWNPAATRDFLVITQAPVNVNADPGTSATMRIVVNNAAPINYQWYKAGIALQDDGRIVGTHTANLTINAIVTSDYDWYSVTVSDACNGPLSAGAHLYPVAPPWSGTCYPNCDNSTIFPYLNANDFQCFLENYAAGSEYANCDQSTSPPVLNANDFQCYLNKFAAGCSAP